MPDAVKVEVKIAEVKIGLLEVTSDGTPQGTKVLYDGKEQCNIEEIVMAINTEGIRVMTFINPRITADGDCK